MERVFLALCVASLAFACSPSAPSASPASSEDGRVWSGLAEPGASPPRTIAVLSLDTLRADHLSVYGYPRPTSPHLEELAREARVYTSARSTAPWTLPSHASLFTGLYPFQHGAHFVAGTLGVEAAALASEARTLAEVLRDLGYRTGAVVANDGFLAPAYRLDQGFDAYDVERDAAPEIVARALGWLDAQGDAPVFLFVNFMDTHQPYNVTPRKGFRNHGDHGSSTHRMRRLRRMLMRGESALPQDVLEALIEQYDLAIANLDAGLGELFEGLRARGRFDDALIVVTADHGEFLGEHDLVEHAKDVYEPVLRVPLIVRPPGGVPAERDDTPISGVHVPGIVLSHAGVAPSDDATAALFGNWPRSRLLAELTESNPFDLREGWLTRLRRVRRAVYRDGVKLIESSDGAHELYDLRDDPREERDLYAERPVLAARLQAELEDVLTRESELARKSRASLVRIEARSREMRELGYLGDDEDE